MATAESQQEIVAKTTVAMIPRFVVFHGAFIQPIKKVTYSVLTDTSFITVNSVGYVSPGQQIRYIDHVCPSTGWGKKK